MENETYIIQSEATGLFYDGTNFSAKTIQDALKVHAHCIPVMHYCWQNVRAIRYS